MTKKITPSLSDLQIGSWLAEAQRTTFGIVQQMRFVLDKFEEHKVAVLDPFTPEEKAAESQLYVHPEDFERRDDGQVVRKDRWEIGIRNVWTAVGGVREPFEISDVVDAVRRLAAGRSESKVLPLTKAERSMLCFMESMANDFSEEDWRQHGFKGKTFDNLKRKLSVL